MFFEMDNSWQSKCSSFWPSPSPSQQFQSQSSRNQIDMTVAQYMHPFVAQETCPVERAIRQEPMVFSSPNLGSCKSGKPEMGSSFLALLSGPFHQLHCEFQQLSNSRSSVSASNPNIHDSNIGITGPSPEVSVPIVSSLTQRHGNESTGNGADLSPALASRALATSTCSRVSVSLDNLQTANLPFHGSDSAKQDLHHMVHSNETVMEVSSLRRGWLTNTVPMNAKQQHTINFEASQKVSEEAKFAVSDHTSSSTRVHPRVFCLGTSGDLFLSNSGCLGVVCSCHNLHMSVANFCEHSGSCAINPGDAVRLESGESIAQWCKLHFVKFGLRVPDDNTGWEWADGSSSASGSARHKAAIGQSMSKNSGIFQPVDPFGGRVWPEQHLSGLVSPKNQYGGQAIMENSASKVIQNSQLRNGLEGQDTHVKNFVGISHGTVPTLADNQTLQTLRDTLSRGLKMSDIAPDNGRKNCRYQSSAGYIGSTSKAGNPFISNQSLENLMPFDKGSDASRYNTSQEAFIMDGDTVHSNIELRLGQPSQQSHTFVGSIPSSIRSQAIGRLSDPQKSQFYEQLIQRAVNPRVTEEYKRNLQSVVPDTKQREREIHMNQMGHALRNLNAAENAALNQFRCDATTSSLSSLFPLPGWHFNTPEGHIPNQASDTIIRNCEHLMPRVFGGDSHVVKCVPADCLRNTCDGMERKLEIHGLGLPNHIDVVKSSGAQADTSSYIPEDLFFRSTSCALSTTAGPFSLPVNLSATNPFYISNLTSALPNKKNIDLGQHLLDDNLRLLALRHIVELSKQGHAITPLETNENRGRIHCPLAMQMQKNGFNENLGTSEIRHGLCPTGPHDPSEVAARPVQSCCNHCLGGSFEKLTCLAGSNKSCNFVTSTHGISLQSKEIGVHNSSRHNCGADKQPLLRLGRDTNNHPSGFGEHSHCIHKEPNPCFLGNCTCAVHSKCLAGSCISRMETIADASKEHIASTGGQPLIQLASPGDNNYMIPKAKKNTLDRCESLERHHLMKSGCQPLHWREVPSKVMENCEPACIEKPEVVTNATETIEDQLADTAAKESKGTPQETESLKEQQMSNVCSASCAPTLTEFSVEGITNGASCSVHARKMRFMRNLVDEGSGTEKCCSSDDALDNGRWAETPTLTGKIDSVMAGSSSTLPNQSSSDLIDEPKLSSSVRLKKAKNQIADGCTVREKIYFQIDRESKIEKKKRAIKWKRLNGASPTYNRYPELHFCSFRGAEKLLQVDRGKQKSCCTYTTGTSNLKRKRSALSSANIIPSWKTKLHGFGGHYRDWEDATQGQSSDSDRVLGIPKISAEIKAKQIISKDVKRNFAKHEVNHKEVEKAPKDVSMGSCDKNTRLVVCGNSGIIANGKSSLPKPAKIVSLSLILKTAARCITTENEEVLRTPFMPVTKEACFRRNEACYDSPSTWKKDTDTGHLPVKRGIARRCSSDRLKPSMHVFKEVRKRSLYELTRKGEDLKERAGFSYLEGKEHSLSTETECHMGVSSQKVVVYASDGKQTSSTKSCLRKISKCLQKTDLRSSVKSSLKNVEGGEGHISEPLQVNGKRSLINGSKRQTFLLDADAFCCVCGSSNKEDFDCLLECSSCLIRVHQACYGVSKVPKGRWGCRPCRAKSENIVCVLCGYKGGAMTRALRSWSIVKSLLQAWKVGRGSKSVSFAVQSDTPKDELSLLNAMPRSGASVHEVPDAVPITRHGSVGSNSTSSNSPGNCFQVHNTITAGVNDPSVKQWVHMVCGLWMPGTRCPNVDTMGAFDVSCVSQARKNVVCSICNRPGGSCIECRVANCSVPFHPWCAHQKGLLQSETEGDDDEKVGFYGRCMRHATYGGCHPDDVHLMDAKLDETSENKESKCERTEGYKGRKRELGFRPNLHTESSDSGGCLVPQEQINAWLHINGQKSGTRGPVKPPAADIEYDCRKEYTRYKQAKGWKHLVLYKSGIHALGLYTSQFISRGAMVVEYVGEIVGLRVADKREMEYHSGRGVQYKSACYFFRIDKEHIIDATRKGGIARFVNHSCLPNCVAKVISVRNEKKVVFFAERDINPGEEITYDYNFNHEDEGKKIPCFCKSKNCRRYLN